jgi:hypothetical protein
MKPAIRARIRLIFSALAFLGLALPMSAQQLGSIRGSITDEATNEPIPFATIVLEGQAQGTTSDFDGNFELTGVPAGLRNIVVSFVGYAPQTIFEIEVTPARPASVQVKLRAQAIEIEAAEVVSARRPTQAEAPLSVRSLGTNEIKRNPGGGRDISRAIRTLPGVAAIPSFRNDIVIRGGAPNENRFYIDGIEIPNINHFATQGASGGPVGMINVDLVENIDFFAGAFPAARGNALSSVLEFSFKEARRDEWTANMVVGTSDLGLTLEGPTGENSSFIGSIRRSYLQLLFEALGLPFLPIYNDYQFKWTWRPDDRNAITVLGLGALDDFELNTALAADTAADDYLERVAILGFLDVQTQWNYTQGAKWDRYLDNGRWTFVASRNMLNNRAYKNADNNPDSTLLRDYISQEIENKFRAERRLYFENGAEATWGLNAEFVKYNNSTDEQRLDFETGVLQPVSVRSAFNAWKYGGFGQLSSKFADNRLTLSAGLRLDGSTAATGLRNPLKAFSPRASASWAFAPGWTLNANTGIYHQLPAYTILGFADALGNRINAGDEARYLSNRQAVAGIRWDGSERNFVVSVEGFFKDYFNAPVSAASGIALANLGADFGVIGNEAVRFDGTGRSYGTEFLVQQRLYKGFYGLLAYTFVRSEYADTLGNFAPSSWDNRHILSLTGGKKWENGWEIGARLLVSGGLPFTPIDPASLATDTWDFYGRPLPDYTLLNTGRNGAFHQLDIRVDKKWFFERWSLDIFFELQNATGAAVPQPPVTDVVRDPLTGTPLDLNADGFYDARTLDPSSGTILPALGMIIEL